MKRPRFAKARILLRRTRRQAPDLVKSGPGVMRRLLADVRENEYTVFLEPVLRLFKTGSGAAEAASALRALDAIAPFSPSVPAPGQGVITVDQSRTGENPVDPRLADEIFARAAPAAIGAEEAQAPSKQDAVGRVPLVRTMVEALPHGQSGGDGGLSDFLPEDLQDVFDSVDHTNPRTKALLKSRERVDVHELAEELRAYARSIGAVPEER